MLMIICAFLDFSRPCARDKFIAASLMWHDTTFFPISLFVAVMATTIFVFSLFYSYREKR